MLKPDSIQHHVGKDRLTFSHRPLIERDRARHIVRVRSAGYRFGKVLNVITHSTHTHVWVSH